MQSPERSSDKQQDATQQDALRDLDALGRERDLLQDLWHGPIERVSRHFQAADADASDPVEVWGSRIGRLLAAFAFIVFCVYLYVTYVR